MKTASYLIAVVLGLGGLIFLIAAGQSNTMPRAIIGVVLLAAAVFMLFLARSKGPETKITHQIDLSGDVHAEELKCKSCGANLDQKSVTLREGGIFVQCPYCGTSYQLEEEPKW